MPDPGARAAQREAGLLQGRARAVAVGDGVRREEACVAQRGRDAEGASIRGLVGVGVDVLDEN